MLKKKTFLHKVARSFQFLYQTNFNLIFLLLYHLYPYHPHFGELYFNCCFQDTVGRSSFGYSWGQTENKNFFLNKNKFNLNKAGILPHCTEYIRKKIPKCHFASNPCRIQFGSRQIVVFREDLLQKMSRNAIKIPDPDKLADDLAKTLICQAHLAPLPLHVVPIYWNYDHVMRLYPLPDLV
ncbi:DNA polymerase epsilon subunit 2, partial [Brachionus plicatilis]